MPLGQYQAVFGKDRQPRKKVMVVSTKKKAPSNKSLNRKIKNIERNFIELKYVDHVPVDENFDHAPLLIPDQGVLINQMNYTIGNRDGSEISTTSLSLKGRIQTSLDKLDPTQVRMIVFWDRQPNGLDAVLAGDNGLLDDALVKNLLYAPRNYTTLHRYKILHDEIMVLTPQAPLSMVAGVTSDVLVTVRPLTYYWKLSRQIKYDLLGQQDTIKDVVTNSINVAFFSDATGDERPTYDGGIRMYYKD